MKRVKDDPNIDLHEWKKEKQFILIFGILLIAYFIIWAVLFTLLDALIIMGLAFFILVPAFITNGMMVLVGKIKGIPRYPLDGGKCFSDGERIFGDGKSWNGFIGGWILGSLISALICWWIFQLISMAEDYSMLTFITPEYIANFIQAGISFKTFIISQIFIALGSPVGDALGSFFKRRRKRKRGEPFLFWDQNDFIIISALIAMIWYPLTWYYWIFLLLITPLVTALANWIGYLINKKDVPW